MDGDQAEVKEHSHSSEFSSASIESTGGTNKGDRGSDVRNPAEVKYDKDEYLMMPPEEKLKHFNCRAQVNEDDQEEADPSFLKAEKDLGELYRREVLNQEEKIKTQLEITSGLYRGLPKLELHAQEKIKALKNHGGDS